MKSLTTAGSAPGFRLAIRYLDNCSWIVLELFGVVSVTNTYCNEQLKIMQSAAAKYVRAIFVLKLTFSGGGVVGIAIRKCTIQRTKKTQNQLNTLYQSMLTILELAGYYRAITPERTVFRQSRRENTP